MTGVWSIFSYLGIFCNFNIIFNLVVGPICRRNLHRQPLHHSTSLVETRLIIELDFYIYLFSMELRSFEKPYVALLNSANTAYNQPVCFSNLIVEIAPYSDILCMNGWTYHSLPLILLICSFWDFTFPCTNDDKLSCLSSYSIHPSFKSL